MPRGRTKYKKRKKQEDPVFKSTLVATLVNNLMRDGKKSTAQRVVYKAFDIIKEKGDDPIETFKNAIENVGPDREVKARRIGGAAYQVPTDVKGERKASLAIRWILEAAHKRPSTEYRTFSDKLSAELLDAAKEAGEAVKKKETSHKMAEANKAFAHFRW